MDAGGCQLNVIKIICKFYNDTLWILENIDIDYINKLTLVMIKQVFDLIDDEDNILNIKLGWIYQAYKFNLQP